MVFLCFVLTYMHAAHMRTGNFINNKETVACGFTRTLFGENIIKYLKKVYDNIKEELQKSDWNKNLWHVHPKWSQVPCVAFASQSKFIDVP